MAGNRMKVLLTSVGSLVGQNILDVLEYPGFSRRSLMRVVGSNSVPDAACNFRCDRCYLLPLTATAEYSARMREILLEESSRSHIVLPRRRHTRTQSIEEPASGTSGNTAGRRTSGRVDRGGQMAYVAIHA